VILSDAQLVRTTYRIRLGRRWLKSLVCAPGGAVLTGDAAEAGRFDGPVRPKGDRFYGPATTVALARQLLGYESRAWCQPEVGPGFWMF
jgi:hypothetical protein